jgi:hypothetical protein
MRKIRRYFGIILCLPILSLLCNSLGLEAIADDQPSPLSNADIIRFTEMRQSGCTIAVTIVRNQTDFHFTDAELKALQSKHVDDSVMIEMLASFHRGGKPGALTAAGQALCTQAGQPSQVSAAQWQTINPAQPADKVAAPQSPPAPKTPQSNAQKNKNQPPPPIAPGQANIQPPSQPVPPAPAPPSQPASPIRSAEAENTRLLASAMDLQTTIQVRSNKDDPSPCADDDKLCIPIDWQQKNSGGKKGNVIQSSGTYRFHIIKLNTPLYQYVVQGQSNVNAPGNDLQLLVDAMASAKQLLATGQQAQAAQAALQAPAKFGATTAEAKSTAAELATCSLDPALNAANGNLQALQTSLTNFLPQRTDKGVPSVPLDQTVQQWLDVLGTFNSLADSVKHLQDELKTASPGCTTEQTLAAAGLITNQFPTMRTKIEAIDIRIHDPHTADRNQYCDRTAGCSVSVSEFSGSEATLIAQGNPYPFVYTPFYSQLSVSAGFLLTTLQARTYSSRTAPDPNNAGQTLNVLGVDGGSGVRPALVAMLNYHIPWEWTDRINQGVAISSGPVIEVANGQADTSKFGLFAGVSFHLWNRFLVSPGVHVGEFADFPQGFTHAGQVIPANVGTPTPTKRYTAKFAFAITYNVKDLSVGNNNAQSQKTNGSKPAPTPAK